METNQNQEQKRKELREKSLNMISEINKIPGFIPEALSDVYTDERSGEEKTMLALAYKKAWFRAKFPLGRLVTENLGYNEEANVVEMKAYAYATNSLDEAPIGEGHVFILVDEFAENQARAITDATLLAEGSAKSRALYEAGFGLQFYRDAEEEEIERRIREAEVEDTSLEEWQNKVAQDNQKSEAFATVTPTEAPAEQPQPAETQTQANEEAPKKRRTNEEIIADNNKKLEAIKGRLQSGEVSVDDVKEEFEELIAENKRKAQSKKIKALISEGELELIEFKLDDFAAKPETNFDGMDLTSAKAVACTHQLYAGKTLGEVYDTKPTLLPRLFEESSDEDERKAIKYLCQNDEDIRAYCERNGKNEVLQ